MSQLYFYLAQQVTESPAQSPTQKPAQDAMGASTFLMMGAIFVLIYFLLIYPQKKEEKRKKAMLASLKKGDPVVTGSGILGTVAAVKDESILVNVGDGVRIEFLRSALSQVREKGKTPKKAG